MMKSNMKAIAMMLLSMVLIMVVAGCGASSGASSGEGDAKKQVTLDFMWFTDGIEGEVIKGLTQEYEKQNPNVKINLIEVPYKDLNTKLKTMIAGGQPPALSRMTDTGAYANQALDLAPYVGTADEFSSQFIDSIKPYYVSDDKIIAAPMDVTANGLIYNKTLFDKAGVQVPTDPNNVWTWDEFKAALKQVMEKGGAKYGLVWDVSPHRWSTMLYQFGGHMISEDGTQSAINSPEAAQALDYFVGLHKEEIAPYSVWLGGENPNNLFRSGTVAAHLAGNWMLSSYKDISNFEWGVTYMPKEQIRSSVPGGKYLMAFEGSKVEKEAADFIKWATSKEINSRYNQESLFISPRKDSSDLDYAFGKEMFKVFADELANTTPLAANDWSRQTIIPKFSTDLKNDIVQVLAEKMTTQQALENAAKLIDEAIAKDKD